MSQIPPVYPLEIYAVYTREEAAELLCISLSTVRRLIDAGQLRVSQPAGMRRVLILGEAITQVGPVYPAACQRPAIEANRIYSREEAAEVLNVSLSSVRRMIASGQLRVSQPPGMRRILILGQALLEMLAATELSDLQSRAQAAD
jgi:excisionase family DNA binding protein